MRGSTDEEEKSVVWFNPKNNNGDMIGRSAWQRRPGGFVPDSNFDWKEFDKPSDKRVTVRLEDIAEIFDQGKLQLSRKDAAHSLATTHGLNDRSAYNALARFNAYLKEGPKGLLSFTAVNNSHSSSQRKFDDNSDE
jgi:hypothetical protein